MDENTKIELADHSGPVVDHFGDKLFTCPACGHVATDNQVGCCHVEQGTNDDPKLQEGHSDWLLSCALCGEVNAMPMATFADLRVEAFKRK